MKKSWLGIIKELFFPRLPHSAKRQQPHPQMHLPCCLYQEYFPLSLKNTQKSHMPVTTCTVSRMRLCAQACLASRFMPLPSLHHISCWNGFSWPHRNLGPAPDKRNKKYPSNNTQPDRVDGGGRQDFSQSQCKLKRQPWGNVLWKWSSWQRNLMDFTWDHWKAGLGRSCINSVSEQQTFRSTSAQRRKNSPQ